MQSNTSYIETNYCRSYDVIRDAGGVHLKGGPKLQDMPFDKAPKTPEGIFRGIEGAGKILETAAFYQKIAVCNPRVRALSELDSFRSYYMVQNLSTFEAMATIWSK